MRTLDAWIFDAYPEEGGMRVWLAGRDGSRAAVLDPWRPYFHAGGTVAQLKSVLRVLEALPYPVETAPVERDRKSVV